VTRPATAAPIPTPADLARRYAAAADDAAATVRGSGGGDLEFRMRAVVDALWTHLHAAGISWVGFYLPHPHPSDPQALVLGPSRNTPACSPIGLHGVCGQAFTGRQVIIIRDVRDLGEAYIACDPRDRSEVVLPLLRTTSGGQVCIAVLDVDSHEVRRFGPADVEGLRAVLEAAGIPAH
jgi:putative methionine-R-sulfoxide reductase with GAF domain